MSALYPSLEDMKVDQMAQAQIAHQPAVAYPAQGGGQTVVVATAPGGATMLYPSLDEYMGLTITPEMRAQHSTAVVPAPSNQIQTRSGQTAIAPVTGNNLGLQRAEIKQGIREVVLCKDQNGKLGMQVRAVNKGIFIAFVYTNSPAALGGLRFGDQILQINGENVAGWDTDKTTKFLKKAAPQRIVFSIRDRPFERTITMQKDSTGHVGFVFKENKITALVKDSSAARNGLLIEHHMVEVNGQNVVGLKESDIKKIFDGCGRTVTITIVPTVIYEHIVKSLGSSLIKKYMDHSIPDI